MAEERVSVLAAACAHLSAACGHFAAAAGLLSRALPQLAPLPSPPRVELPPVAPRHDDTPPRRRRPIPDDEPDVEPDDVVVDPIDPIDDDDDDCGFSVYDLYNAVIPLVTAIPPYPLHRSLPKSFLETTGWACLLFVNALCFTAAVTYYSVVVFRSSRRCLPTLLRSLLLAVTMGAEIAAAFHLPPSSPVALGLSYASVILHVLVYLMTWVFWSRRRRQRLHPVP